MYPRQTKQGETMEDQDFIAIMSKPLTEEEKEEAKKAEIIKTNNLVSCC